MIDYACPGDCPVLARIDAVSNAEPWSEKSFLTSLDDPSFAVLVYRLPGGEPVGFIVCEFQGDLLAVDEIAVPPEHRRRGIATELLAAAEKTGAANGCVRMTLEVRSGNAGAISLYECNGFSKEGIRKAIYGNPPDDGVVMMKIISVRQN